jgi:autotransporter-associated beta strand protein
MSALRGLCEFTVDSIIAIDREDLSGSVVETLCCREGAHIMNRLSSLSSWIAAAAIALALIPVGASAQSVSTFLGGSGTTATTQQSWTTSGNWSPAGVPTGTSVWAQINSSTSPILRILYTSTSVGSGTSLTVGAISFLPTLASSGSTYDVQNNSSGTKGTLKFYGVDTTVDAQPRRIILSNSSTLSNITFTQTLAGQDFELYTSGAVNVATGAQLSLTPLIRDGSGSQSITKIGQGILAFSGSSEASTYAGGFVMDGGVVQWALSGGAAANPFGIGALTMRSGTLRSTTTSGRSINSSIVLDGSITLGSADPSFTGNITVNSSGGALTTSIASNSVLTIAGSGSTAWAQATSGTGGLTKAGTGVLRFTGVGGNLNHTGNTVVQSGTLIMAANLASASAVSVLNAATLLGTGTIAGATSFQAGSVFSPGAVSGTTGVFTFGSGGLTLAGQTVMDLQGATRGSLYDGIDLGGSLGYGGSLLLQVSGSMADGTYELFKNFTSQAGSFSSVSLAGFYSGSLTESPAGVWTGTAGSQNFTFTNSTGNLVIVPEPAITTLAGLGAAAVAGRWWRRGRRRCSHSF